MNILIIFIAVTVVVLFLTVTALIMTIKNTIKLKQEIKTMKHHENAYQYYMEQEIKINEQLNTEKDKITQGNINELFNQHFNGVPNYYAKPKIPDHPPPTGTKNPND